MFGVVWFVAALYIEKACSDALINKLMKDTGFFECVNGVFGLASFFQLMWCSVSRVHQQLAVEAERI